MKALFFIALATSAFAQSSADYALTTTVLDHAGGAQASADYAQTSSLHVIHGTSGDATPSIARSGFAAQLYDVVSLAVTPATSTVPEASTQQFTATVTLDDSTTLTSAATWAINSGPLVSITSTGLLTTGHVYADTTARITATHGELSQLVLLTVRNIGSDDFGLYAGDGVPDLWQVTWFGENNLDGRADKDPDHDGQNNAFEQLSGYSPLDATEMLRTHLLSWDGAEARLEVSRVLPGTVYGFETSTDLAAWTQADKHIPTMLAEPFIQTLPATEPAMFFRVKLSKAP